MTIQLDHVFVLTSPGAPEADALLRAGLQEGPSNEHPGQGTANRRFFFANTTLEFLFVADIAQAMNGPGKGLRFVERAIDVSGSPFGLVTRVIDNVEEPNFPAWKYFPDYFPKPMCFFVGNNSDIFDEPLCVCMPPALPKASPPTSTNTLWELTELVLATPVGKPSMALTAFEQCDLVTVEYGKPHALTLTFNNGTSGESLSLQPDAPLTLHW